MRVFSVYDKKAEAFLQPFFSKTRGIAMRSFVDACTRGDHDFALHPGDFILYELASWNELNGSFEDQSVMEVMTGFDARSAAKAE